MHINNNNKSSYCGLSARSHCDSWHRVLVRQLPSVTHCHHHQLSPHLLLCHQWCSSPTLHMSVNSLIYTQSQCIRCCVTGSVCYSLWPPCVADADIIFLFRFFLLLSSFFLARQSCAMVRRRRIFGDFFVLCIFSEPRAACFRPASEIHTKATSCVEVW